MKIAVIDNYDSFVYNIIHYLESFENIQTMVMKNDQINWDILYEVDRIVLSPGPGIPSEAGNLMLVIEKFHNIKPILGICLGHQAIGEFFGASLKNLDTPLHGISSLMNKMKDDVIWEDVSFPSEIGHYHSWVIDSKNFPNELSILSIDENKNIMAISHDEYKCKGVQFHPESVLTVDGKKIIENWLFKE